MGRPTDYSEDTINKICARIAKGESLRTIERDDDMPCMTTIMKWKRENEDFAQQYARAKQDCADYYAEEIIQIADDGSNDTYYDEDGNKRTDQDVIARSRLRVDARKWYASKLAPKKYGDRQEIEHSGGIKVARAQDLTDDELASIALQHSKE